MTLPDREQLARVAGALGLLVVALRVWSLMRYDAPAGVDSLSARQVGTSSVLLIASGLTLIGRLPAAGPALLVGVTLPQACLSWASLAQFQAVVSLPSSGMTVTPAAVPLLSWLHAVVLTLTLLAAALALAARPDLRRLRRDPVGVAVLLLGATYAGWAYADQRFGLWHESSPVLGVTYDALLAAAVVLPLLWGLGLPQPSRKLLLAGWVVTQAVYWSAWFRPWIPQREYPFLFLIPPLLVLAAVAALRPAGEIEGVEEEQRSDDEEAGR